MSEVSHKTSDAKDKGQEKITREIIRVQIHEAIGEGSEVDLDAE